MSRSIFYHFLRSIGRGYCHDRRAEERHGQFSGLCKTLQRQAFGFQDRMLFTFKICALHGTT